MMAVGAMWPTVYDRGSCRAAIFIKKILVGGGAVNLLASHSTNTYIASIPFTPEIPDWYASEVKSLDGDQIGGPCSHY
jgi:hypothetical protein